MALVRGGESLTVSEEGALLGLLVLSLVTNFVFIRSLLFEWLLFLEIMKHCTTNNLIT